MRSAPASAGQWPGNAAIRPIATMLAQMPTTAVTAVRTPRTSVGNGVAVAAWLRGGHRSERYVSCGRLILLPSRIGSSNVPHGERRHRCCQGGLAVSPRFGSPGRGSRATRAPSISAAGRRRAGYRPRPGTPGFTRPSRSSPGPPAVELARARRRRSWRRAQERSSSARDAVPHGLCESPRFGRRRVRQRRPQHQITLSNPTTTLSVLTLMHTRINRRPRRTTRLLPIPGCHPTRRYPVRMGNGTARIASDLVPDGVLRAAINLA